MVVLCRRRFIFSGAGEELPRRKLFLCGAGEKMEARNAGRSGRVRLYEECGGRSESCGRAVYGGAEFGSAADGGVGIVHGESGGGIREYGIDFEIDAEIDRVCGVPGGERGSDDGEPAVFVGVGVEF